MNYYNEIKNELINNEVYKKVKDYSKNRSDLQTYYNVGKLLSEAGKQYGKEIIKQYSIRLTKELNKKYSVTSLKYMRMFYNYGKSQPLADQLSWSHYIELLPLKDINKINYYIKEVINHNLSKRDLREKIKNNEYERLPIKTRNKLINKEKVKISDMIKNPIIIKNKYNNTSISEKILKRLILEDIDTFLKELGDGFCYIGNEYKIKLGDSYNYIDILLFNIKYNCYVVIELKITELKKEYIGQIEVYMNYVDNNVKNIYHDKTIGIIICKKENKFIIEYTSDKRILQRKYILK